MKKISVFLSLLIFLAAFNSCVQERTFPVSEQVKQQIALLPQDAAAYGYVNFKRLHNAEFSKFFTDSMKAHLYRNEEFLEFMEETGLDPQKDLKDAYFAAKPGLDEDKPSVMVVAFGDFEPDKIIGFIKEQDREEKLLESDYEGYKLYSTDKKQFTFCFKDKNTLLGGSKEDVLKYLDSKPDQRELSKTVVKDLEKLKYKKGMWFTVNAEVWKDKIRNEQLNRINGLKSIETIGFSMDLTDKFKMNARGLFTDEEKSKLFEEAIRGFIATGKLSVSDDRDVIDILNSIKVKSDKKSVKVDFELSEEEAKKLMKKKNELSKKVFKAV
jgi:hypothetical protein